VAATELIPRQAHDEQLREFLRAQSLQMLTQLLPKLLAMSRILEHGGYGLLPRRGVLQRVLQQLRQVEHLDVVLAQDPSEDVVFLLGPFSPWQRGQEQPALLPRRHPTQLRPGPVHEHRP
jgi:hypothetical protein